MDHQAAGIRQRLAGLRARARLALGLRGAATLLLAGLGLCLLSFALDRTLRLTVEARAAVLLGMLGVIAWLVQGRLVRPLSVPLSDRELARVIEGLWPELDWRVLSAVEFSDPEWRPGAQVSTSLARLVVQDAERLVPSVELGRAVPGGPMFASAVRGAAFALAGLALVLAFPQGARTWAERNLLLSRSAAWPRDTRLTMVEPVLLTRAEGVAEVGTTLAVPRGAELTITVVAAGSVPSRVYLETEDQEGRSERIAFDALEVTESGRERVGRFRTSLLQLTESFSFRVVGGDDELGPVQVEVKRRPWIEAVEFQVTPPPYTGLPPRRFGLEAGSVTLPRGTQVQVAVRSSKPLREGRLIEQAIGADAAAVHTGQPSGPNGFACRFELGRTAVFAVELTDQDGLEPDQPTRFSLTAQPDAPPEVSLGLRGVGLNVTPQARLRWTVGARDDLGLGGGALRWRLARPSGEETAEEQGLSELAGQLRHESRGLLELEPKKLPLKSTVTLWGEASDKDPHGPNLGVSPSVQLRVVDDEALLNELLRRLHEQRQELERMVGEEERLAQGLSGADEATLERAPRTQRDVARAVLRAAEVVEQVVDELWTNQLLDEQAEAQLQNDVAAPLRRTEATTLAEARALAEQAQATQGEARPQVMARAGQAATRVGDELRTIVARMIRIEDLAELISLLKRTIRRQEDLLDKTRKNPR